MMFPILTKCSLTSYVYLTSIFLQNLRQEIETYKNAHDDTLGYPRKSFLYF